MNIQVAMENLQKRGFEVSFFENADMACEYLMQEIHGATVGIGGSMTAMEMGLFEKLGKKNMVYWHTVQADRETAIRGAARADVYITSANGIAESGEIINIDGAGNRVAASLYGKETVYIVVGINKFADTFDEALWRARNVAAPLNCRRLKLNTPCAQNADRCYDCSSPDRICNGLVVLWRKMFGVKKAEVVIINEQLGY